MKELFDLRNNPLFFKFVRSRLRKNTLLPGILIVALCCIVIIVVDQQIIKVSHGPDELIGPHIFFFLQCFILGILGGSQVANATSHIHDSGIIELHRITPMPAHIQAIGIILGAPIRELITYTVTLPFSFLSFVLSDMDPLSWFKLVIVEIGIALIYYTVAMMAGLSSHSRKGASGRFIIFIGLMNILSFSLFYPFQFFGPALLTVTPIYKDVLERQVIENHERWQQKKNGRVQHLAAAEDIHEVTFYSLPIPIVLQSMVFQSTFIFFFFVACSRRVRSSRIPLYPKAYALAFFLAICFLMLGSVWKTTQVVQILGLCYFLPLCGIGLSFFVSPLRAEFLKGCQRALRGHGTLSIWNDLATGRWIFLLFGLVMCSAIASAILLSPLNPPPQFILRGMNGLKFQPWAPLVVSALLLLSFVFAQQFFRLSNGKNAGVFTLGLIILWWVAPIPISFMITEADPENEGFLISFSPIIGIATSGLIDKDQDQQLIQMIAIIPATLITSFFLAVQFAVEKKLRSKITSEASELAIPDNQLHPE